MGGGDAVLRRELGEAGERRGLLPRRLVQRAIDRHVGGDARNADMKLVVTPAIYVWREERCDQKRPDHDFMVTAAAPRRDVLDAPLAGATFAAPPRVTPAWPFP